jgi:hypothetical protein
MGYKQSWMKGKDGYSSKVKKSSNKFIRHGERGGGRPMTGRLDVGGLCKFQSKRSGGREVEEYLEYIRKIYPNESNNLGVLMHSKIDETRALEVLHETQYQTSSAQFLVTFPTLCRQMRVRTCGADLGNERLKPIFEKYVTMNSQLHSKNEATHFTQVLSGIDSGKLDMTFDQLSEIIMEARSNKFKLPASVRKLFEDSFNGSRDIEKMLEGSKKMDDLQLLFKRLRGLLVPPQNFYRLKEFLEKARAFQREILELMTGPHRNYRDMQGKMNALKMLSLKTTVGDPLHEFKELWEKTHRYLEDIQYIVNPYNTKSNQRKSDFNKATKILNFFIENKIQDPKIDALCALVSDTQRVVNVASLFLQDMRPAQPEFLKRTLDFLQKSKFDMKGIIEKVKEKADYLDQLDALKRTWKDHTKISQNLKRIEKLKKFDKNESAAKLEEYEANVFKLQHIT